MTAPSEITALESTATVFADEWERIERSGPVPVHIRNVEVVSYGDFCELLTSGNRDRLRSFAESLYAGDGFIIKGAYSQEFMNDVIARSVTYAKAEEPSFHKMYDDAPDFHRVIEQSVAGNYGAFAIRHVFHFYNWNDDPVGMIDEMDRRWAYFKALSGNSPLAFTRNKPSDGVIDRYHVYHYPKGGGSLETHSDPVNNQRTILAAMASKRGDSYDKGGFYFVEADGTHRDCEPMIDIGDMVICYASVYHGVEMIDPDDDLDWSPDCGRWFLGLYSVDSDHVKDRTTVIGVAPEKEMSRVL